MNKKETEQSEAGEELRDQDIERNPSPGEIKGSDVAREVGRGDRERKKRSSDEGILIKIMALSLGETDQRIVASAEKVLLERYPQEINENVLTEMGNLLKSLLTEEHWKAVWSQIDEFSKQAEYSHASEKRREIILGFCLPVIHGHLTANDVLNVAQEASITENDPSAGVTTSYKAPMQVKFGNLIISKAVFLNTFNADDPGFELDLTHMTAHEVSHGITDQLYFEEIPRDNLTAQINEPNPQFSSELIRVARIIIDQSEKVMDMQPKHIRQALLGLNQAQHKYQGFNQKTKDALASQIGVSSAEEYEDFIRVNTAKEIITDYTAIFLQSDGTFDNFMSETINHAETEAIKKYLGETLSEPQEITTEEIIRKLVSLNNGDSKDLSPKIMELLKYYSIIFRNLAKDIDGVRGDVKQPAIPNEDIGFDLDDLDLSFNDFANYNDGFSKGPSSNGDNKKMVDEFTGLATSFFKELGL
ncbi:MAG TPA: hypothetical protein PK263_04800, partial [bacterium]|nr:hypothetical protein [bacterium]